MQVRKPARRLFKVLGTALLSLALVPMIAQTADAQVFRGRGWGRGGWGWGRGFYARPYRGFYGGGWGYGPRVVAPVFVRPGFTYSSGYFGGAFPNRFGYGFAAPMVPTFAAPMVASPMVASPRLFNFGMPVY
jgi:hypothetical protein